LSNYHMNKKECEITDTERMKAVLKNGKFAVISMCHGDKPYIVTLNYGYDPQRNALYFHTANKGLKLEFIKKNSRVCATIIEDNGYKMGECDHAYRSIVFWGTMSVVEELQEKKHGMEVLLRHLEKDPDPIRERLLKNDSVYKKRNMEILRLDITEITGKQGD
jgi:nitroimidazol reductase NimA-like FMN-containing flavoprotein (pyridoxamine 5'-phosphate oxidase superfamily)